jgi:N-hydroxyarylamine O-acetyltransferase
MEEEYPVDFVMMNHYIATHPASFFAHNILASAVLPQGGRVNIMNQGVHIIRDGKAEAADLPDRRALRSLVAEHFGFDLPELETMRVDAVPGWG